MIHRLSVTQTTQYEVELKFPLASPSEMLSRLASLGAVAASPIEQVDRYFNHPARDFGDTDEAFRILSESLTPEPHGVAPALPYCFSTHCR